MSAKKEKKGKKVMHTSGRRKKAVARATIKEGKGNIKINNVSLEVLEPKLCRMKIKEPLLLAEDISGSIDINVNVRGGGVMSGAEAARLAIGRALIEWAGKSKLKDDFAEYDRRLLVADVRFREPRKPNISRARAKRQKSYR